MSSVEDVRRVMHAFVDERLAVKLDGLKLDQVDRRAELVDRYKLGTWLRSAAARVKQVQLATHTTKQMHPRVQGTQLHVTPRSLDALGLVGTGSLPERRKSDVVGNAGALDVSAFLEIEFDGDSLLSLMLARDPAVTAALSDDPIDAESLRTAFASIVEGRNVPASHALAKQLYFPIGGEAGYHILAPLFPSTVAHQLWETVNNHRSGDAAKEARGARRAGAHSGQGLREYPGLAIQCIGGGKPWNISQLNKVQNGEAYLLASMPPAVQDQPLPLGLKSVFRYFGEGKEFGDLLGAVRSTLRMNNLSKEPIRKKARQILAEICDEMIFCASRVQCSPAGWSKAEGCMLDTAEKLWLDPPREGGGGLTGEVSWSAEIGDRFGKWLNRELSTERSEMRAEESAIWSALVASEVNGFRGCVESFFD